MDNNALHKLLVQLRRTATVTENPEQPYSAVNGHLITFEQYDYDTFVDEVIALFEAVTSSDKDLEDE